MPKAQLPGRWINGGERIDTSNVRFLPLHRVVERTELDLEVAPRTDGSYPAVPDVPEQPSLAIRLFDAACWAIAAVVLVAVIYSIDIIDFLMQPNP